MFSKTNLISTVVGAIWCYAGGYLLWKLIGDQFFSKINETEPVQMHMVIACLISAFAFSTIYSKLSDGGHSLSHGATFGVWVGILIGFGERWFDFAFGQMNLHDALVNGILNIVLFAVLGVLTSLVYSKVK